LIILRCTCTSGGLCEAGFKAALAISTDTGPQVAALHKRQLRCEPFPLSWSWGQFANTERRLLHLPSSGANTHMSWNMSLMEKSNPNLIPFLAHPCLPRFGLFANSE